MKTVCDVNMCNACMVCIDICPKHAITIKDDIFAFNADIDEQLCIHCDMCAKVCPNVNIVSLKKPMDWYEGWADEQIRVFASSGGVASAIMNAFIIRGGWGASCIFKDGVFQFDITNDLNMTKRFAGSKYVKSNPRGIYKKIEDKLQQGINCLFIGLPCQVAALYNYIKHPEKLYTIDLICHGSPSSEILKKFLQEEKIDIQALRNISFRTKTCFEIIPDYKRIVPLGVKDMYTYAYMSSLDYTDNCYSCKYATLERVADITLGDSWRSELGLEEQKRGISLILCQTEKGRKLLSDAAVILKKVDLNKAIEANHQLEYPSIMPKERTKFFKYLKRGFNYSLSRCYPKIYYKQKLKRKLIQMKTFLNGESLIM